MSISNSSGPLSDRGKKFVGGIRRQDESREEFRARMDAGYARNDPPPKPAAGTQSPTATTSAPPPPSPPAPAPEPKPPAPAPPPSSGGTLPPSTPPITPAARPAATQQPPAPSPTTAQASTRVVRRLSSTSGGAAPAAPPPGKASFANGKVTMNPSPTPVAGIPTPPPPAAQASVAPPPAPAAALPPAPTHSMDQWTPQEQAAALARASARTDQYYKDLAASTPPAAPAAITPPPMAPESAQDILSRKGVPPLAAVRPPPPRLNSALRDPNLKENPAAPTPSQVIKLDAQGNLVEQTLDASGKPILKILSPAKTPSTPKLLAGAPPPKNSVPSAPGIPLASAAPPPSRVGLIIPGVPSNLVVGR